MRDTKHAKPATNPWRAKHPQRYWAHRATASAIRAGLLEKKPCEQCGEAKVDAHHSDYNRPLLVQWLCRKCHAGLHAAERRRNRGA